MRSFIKSHRRGHSLGTELVPNNELKLETDQELESNNSTNSSPSRLHTPTSPSYKQLNLISTSSSSNKLQRLFQRSKNSSPNLSNYSLPPPPASPNSTSFPAIVGTRTHEWGAGSSNSTSTGTTAKNNPSMSKRSSGNSFTSFDEPIITFSTSPKKEEPAPLAKVRSENSIMDTKMLKTHRRKIQIISNSNSFSLEDPPLIIPNKSFIYHDKDEFDLSDECEELTGSGKPKLVHQLSDVNEESIETISIPHVLEREKSSSGSEFSFEEDKIKGRNVSIKYYKSESEANNGTSSKSAVKEKGFYINDFIDDDFDDDMNYYDEDDEFNDDEELFNKKYFSDDEPEDEFGKGYFDGEPEDQPSKEDFDGEPEDEPAPQPTVIPQPDTSPQFKRHLKYHQLPTNLDQEFRANDRYAWITEEYERSSLNINRDSVGSYDSLLDEINNVPEDFDLKNLIKRSKTIQHSDLNQQTIKQKDKTITLFSRSNTINVPFRTKKNYLSPITESEAYFHE